MGNNYDTQRMGNVYNIEEGFTFTDTERSSGFLVLDFGEKESVMGFR